MFEKPLWIYNTRDKRRASVEYEASPISEVPTMESSTDEHLEIADFQISLAFFDIVALASQHESLYRPRTDDDTNLHLLRTLQYEHYELPSIPQTTAMCFCINTNEY
ncbi:hypothetical protein WA026_015354 [Henosepilachna vigintioctopunctata]|uniref:Uncharacterized protein n=1 Tax=Henosepilachna vigintioctopunctata TaxID=420089 RepID=A0AAW1UN53_9CUCU